MANPRQRRKARSSSHKPVSHSKHAKRNLKKTPPVRGPRALQQAWDNRKTVKQNYALLGLIHDLNPSAPGGSEKIIEPRYDQDAMTVDQPPQEGSSGLKPPVPRGFGRIIRNESGKVIGVELSEEDAENEKEVVEDETMEDLEAEVEKSDLDKWATRLGQKSDIVAGKRSAGLLEELESIALLKHMDSNTLAMAQSSMPHVRHPATGEMAYLSRLVEKHGEDVGRMAKDRRLNPDQRTEGQLRRALRNGGIQRMQG